MRHLTIEELEAGLDGIRLAPSDNGVLHLIVRRPDTGVREVIAEGQLDCIEGLVGDSWIARERSRTPDGTRSREAQLTVMNSRLIALVAQDRNRWQLAGDQLFIDLDLSTGNVPPGTQLALGSAVIEVTAQPHANCQKFAACFGLDAMKWVDSAPGRRLQLRGINAKVVRPGVIRVGDAVRKAPG